MYVTIDSSCNPELALSFYSQFLERLVTAPIFKDKELFFISDWISISAHELQETVQQSALQNADGELVHVRRCFVDSLIEKVNKESFGASANYELFEARKQETLSQIFEYLALTKEEVMLIKKKCSYEENFEPYSVLCECGTTIDALQSAQSLSHSGKELCGQCLGMTF